MTCTVGGPQVYDVLKVSCSYSTDNNFTKVLFKVGLDHGVSQLCYNDPGNFPAKDAVVKVGMVYQKIQSAIRTQFSQLENSQHQKLFTITKSFNPLGTCTCELKASYAGAKKTIDSIGLRCEGDFLDLPDILKAINEAPLPT